MPAIVFDTLDYSGTPDEQDIRVATQRIDDANAIITANNEANQTSDPLWPKSNNAEIKASYLSVLLEDLTSFHARRVIEENARTLAALKDAWASASDADRASIEAILGL